LNVLKCTVSHTVLLVAHFKAQPLFMFSHLCERIETKGVDEAVLIGVSPANSGAA
jgi:hypothetical protein